MRLATAGLVAAAVLAVSTAAGAGEATPNRFLAKGPPTFVVGTAGDDDCDRRVRAQAELVRDLVFPGAEIVEDVSIDPAAGAPGWPERPVLYGGPHVNSLLAALGERLPFELAAGRLRLGERVFDGDEYRLLAVVPARTADDGGAGWPEFLLYAGTGTPGVAEINAVPHGSEPLLVADRFGRLAVGRWERTAAGRAVPVVTATARRIEWRTTIPVPGLRIHRARVLPVGEGEAERDEALAAALTGAAAAIGVEEPVPVEVHLYPDRRSKLSLTGNGGDGHAVVACRTLHLLVAGDLRGLAAHEGTHVYAYHHWGPAGTPLMAEGLAVRVAGRYGGRSLAAWDDALPGEDRPARNELVTGFRRLPERVGYPLAGLLVDELVRERGLDTFREELYPAGPDRLLRLLPPR